MPTSFRFSKNGFGTAFAMLGFAFCEILQSEIFVAWQVTAHASFIACVSPVVSSMLSSNMKEGKSKRIEVDVSKKAAANMDDTTWNDGVMSVWTWKNPSVWDIDGIWDFLFHCQIIMQCPVSIESLGNCCWWSPQFLQALSFLFELLYTGCSSKAFCCRLGTLEGFCW